MGNEHQTDRQTNRHVNSMTDPAQRAEAEKSTKVNNYTNTKEHKYTSIKLHNYTSIH